ncbi:2-deoxy-scyllo-inosamine dehydrogenase [Prauserella coralliicola]|nr:2-deoxy-scyllo-inosamine dehydrogenase [Prauserella coralliicola]
MRVANTIEAGRLEFQERLLPWVGRGAALIRVEHVTLCGTDLHIWEGEYMNPFPIVQGHEFVGLVEALAADETGAIVGERVVVSPVRACGRCHACCAGRSNVCQEVSVLGCYEDGALADYVLAPIEALRRVPEGLPAELAPLSEPASIALQAVGRGRPEQGELALVIGCGPIGLIAALALADAGVDVIAADTLASRAEAAVGYGAKTTLTVDPAAAFPTARELARAAGDESRPITLVIEATGAPAAFAAALDVAAPTARVVAVGISDGHVSVPIRTIPFKELDVLGSRNSLDLIDDGLALIRRHSDAFAGLITHRYRFEQVEQALDALRAEASTVRKVLVSLVD